MKRLLNGAAIGALCVLFSALTVSAWAQDTSVTGGATDATDARLPGVTVTALHVDTGNTFVGVTDASGNYQISGLRTGVYKVTADLSGFRPVVQENIELLVGQRAVINFRMTLSSRRGVGDGHRRGASGRRHTVKAWRQRRLPSGAGASGKRPQLDAADDADTGQPNQYGRRLADSGDFRGSFQLNLDGQQVTQLIAQTGYGQPRFSRDAMAEFQFVTSRFDATQGRSSGAQVNAVTKSGTNTFSGHALRATSGATSSTPKTSSSSACSPIRISR